MVHSIQDPHNGQPVLWHGPSPAAARLAVILVHGRGGSAEDMLGLAEELGVRDVAYAAPQAAGHTWYPYSFLAPIAQNEPGISSGLRVLSGLVGALEQQGHASNRIAIIGFSQGACLALEFAARHAHRYAAVVGLSGGLIGPPGTPRNYDGSLEGTPVFLGCSDADPHIPLERVHESAEVFRQLGAAVDERIYRQMGHTVNPDELQAVNALLATGPMSQDFG
ncbi:MAG: phospholipase [Luteitalea sp.]|nr:phospholipase [Luteitalea sp.]